MAATSRIASTSTSSRTSPRRPASPSSWSAEPTGEAWLVQLEQASKAGVAPADVSMMAQVPLLKGMTTELWAPLDLAKMPNDGQRQAGIHQQISGRPRRRRRRRDLVHHAGHQHEDLPGGADELDGAVGSGQQGPRSACWRWSRTRSCSRSPPRPISAAPTSCRARRTSSR